MADSPRRAAVLGGDRTPFARAQRAYAHASSHDLLLAALDGLAARFALSGQRLGEVVAGAVLRHSRDLTMTREAVLSSALAPTTPAYDISQACATGLEAAIAVANKIALGQVEVGVAGGVESMTDAPVALGDDVRRVLLAARSARRPTARAAALARLRPSQLRLEAPSPAEARTGLSMGEHAAITAAAWGISRQAQDEIALASHQRLAAAWERGFFDDLVTPYLGLGRDDVLRPDTSAAKLASLPPVFGRDLVVDGAPAPATMTAGNSTPFTDGASAVLLASDEWAREHDIPVLAHVVDAETAAVDFVHPSGGESAWGRAPEGLLMAPVHAVPRLLARQQLTLGDVDVVEIHEAFASTVLATLAAWEDADYCRDVLGLPGALGRVDRQRLNPAGSSLATGHPFGATGTRILATAAKQLHERGGGRALISICAAGGLGVAAILEA